MGWNDHVTDGIYGLQGGVMSMTGLVAQLVDRPIVHNGERVVTLAWVDRAHGRPEGTAGRNFRAHRGELDEGVDYFMVPYEEWADWEQTTNFVPCSNAPGYAGPLTVLTCSGYAMLCKSLNDALAWRIQRELVRHYFISHSLQTYEDRLDYAKLAKSVETGCKNAILPVVEDLAVGQMGLKKDVSGLREEVDGLRYEIRSVVSRRPLTAKTKRQHLNAIVAMGRRCPCCHIIEVVDEDGNKLACSEWEHWHSPKVNDVWRTWLTCKTCNDKLNKEGTRQNYEVQFNAYQKFRELYENARAPYLPGM